MLRLAIRLLRGCLTWLVALLLLFEEWGWEPLARLVGQLGRLPPFAWLERRIAQLPPYLALAVFVVPMVALFPIKLLALYWVAQGHRLLGLGVIVAAKLLGTAVVARLFQLTKTSLMTLGWFSALYARWAAWKAAVMVVVRASAAWRAGRVVKAAVRRRLRTWRGTFRRAG